MIRVLNISSDSNIGGAGRVLLNYLRYADRARFETLIAVPRGSLLKAPLEEAGGRVLEVDGLAERSYHRGDVAALTRLIREQEPDVVHTHGSLSGRIAGRRCGKTVIYTRHSAFPVSPLLRYPPGRWANKLVNEHYADHIIAVSPAAAENLTDGGISRGRITVMMNGVAPVARCGEAVCAEARARWGIEPGDFVTGILARIEPYKGHLHIVEAAELLRAEGRRFKVLIAGEGSFEAELRGEVERRGLSDVIRFLGFQRDVAPFLSVLDVQLNASYGTETSSLSILEGFSMGVPAVVSDYGGNPWLVDGGEDGLLFPSRSGEGLKNAVVMLMDEPDTLERMRRRSVEIYRQRFTGEIFARNVEQVYINTLKEKKHGK